MNVASRLIFFLAFTALFSLSCKHKAPEDAHASSSSANLKVMIDFSFAIGEGGEMMSGIAIIDPWELKPGEMWRCDVAPESLRSVVIVKRVATNNFYFAAGEGKMNRLEARSEGSFCMHEGSFESIAMDEPVYRSIFISAVTSAKADEIKKALQDAGEELLSCKKESEVEIPKTEPPPQVQEGE